MTQRTRMLCVSVYACDVSKCVCEIEFENFSEWIRQKQLYAKTHTDDRFHSVGRKVFFLVHCDVCVCMCV